MGTTKKPTGMSVTRDGAKITCTWKKPEKYNDGQQCYVRLKVGGYWGHYDSGNFKSGWLKMSCTNTTKAKTYENTLSRYYPNSGKKKLTEVEFKVRGKHSNDDKWSGYTTDSFEVNPPHKPTLTKSVTEGVSNQATFSWTLSTKDTSSSHAWFTQLEWEAILIKGCQETKGSDAFSYPIVSGSKQTGTSTTSSSKTITESNIADGSYSRWFRCRANGPGGSSDWVYAHQTYAVPNRAVNVENDVINSPSGGYEVYTEYSASSDAAYPIDTTTVQYALATPAAGLTYPSSGSSLWTDGNTTAHKTKNDEMRFHVNTAVDLDECLFVRVNNTYNSQTTEGYPWIAKYGKLKTPSITALSTNDTNHKATITATNNSDVPDSFLAIIYQGSTHPQKVVGIIPAGSTDPVVVQCPDWSTQTAKKFGVYAVVGNASYTTDAANVKTYTFTPYSNKELMVSDATWQGGTVPQAPSSVSVAQTNTPGTVRVNWNWPWDDADGAEISWADHEDAWESTDQPETYKISSIHTGQWNIAGLTTGMKWYIRVRLIKGGDNEVYGPYSETQSINLSSAPNVPTLVLSAPIVSKSQSFTASWGYSTTDGTGQGYAEICEATISGGVITYGTPFIHTTTAQHVTIDANRWNVNTTHYLCVRVVSQSGQVCDEWSAPVPIKVANPLSCSITTGSNLSNVTVEDDSVDGTTKTVLGLTDMPLTVTVTGAGDFGYTTLAIERAESYFLEQPNETYLPAHEGETVALVEQMGAAAITIDNDDLIGTLDDGAAYKFVATVSDTLGQRATAELPFEVHWTNQAKAPAATITIDNTNLIAKITPTATSPGTGDTCDIYRLSVDRPSLVYSGAAFSTQYVDPYPTIGEYGGYRIVYKTKNGDYTTTDGELAFTDYKATDSDTYKLSTMYNIIEFGGDMVQLMYDVTLSSSWEKDFQATQYLGGAVQGDWNPAVNRTGSVTSRVVTIKDQATIQAMRRLADYAGICHVRTRDGSSYPANVDVSENYNMGQEVIAREFTVSITRVDPEGFDGQTYADWVNS